MTDVYRNLARRCWSVREGGRVIEHVAEIALRDVRLIVQPGGRATVIRTGTRSVHAYARGTRIPFEGVPSGSIQVGYNPFEAEIFTFRPGFSKALSCRVAVFTDSGIAFALL